MEKKLLALVLAYGTLYSASSRITPKESLRIKTFREQPTAATEHSKSLYSEKDLEIIVPEEAQESRYFSNPYDIRGNTIPRPINGFRKTLTSAGKITKNIKRTKKHIVAMFACNAPDINLICQYNSLTRNAHAIKDQLATTLVIRWTDSQGIVVFKKMGKVPEFLAFPAEATGTKISHSPSDHTYKIKDGFIIIKIPIKH